MKSQAAAPLYQKVKDHVLRQIRAGHWRASDRIPSESELVREFKISRMTANRALRELCDSGIITHLRLKKRKGWFRAPVKASSLFVP